MKNLTEQQLLDNYQKLVDIVEETFEGERKENLLYQNINYLYQHIV